MKLSARIYDVLMGHRVVALALLLAFTAALGAGAARVKFDNSYRIWFVEGDPALVAYDAFLDRFGSDEFMVLAISTGGDAYSEPTLRLVKGLSDALGKLPGVQEVWSLTHMEAMTDAGGAIELRPLIPEIPPSGEDLKLAKALVRESPLYRNLVSRDNGHTMIMLTLEQTEGSFDPKARLVRKARTLATEMCPGRRILLAGGPVLDEAMYRYSEQDSLRYAPVMTLILVLALGLLFRSLVAILLPLAVVALAVVWAVGFMGWMGWDANMVTTILPVMLAAVGIADAVHLLQQLRLQYRQGAAPDVALRRAFVHVLRPCLLTSVTTAAGMASLTAANLGAIRELGLTAAVGVMGAFLLTMVGMPLILSVLSPRRMGGISAGHGRVLSRLSGQAAAMAVAHPRKVTVAALLLVALACAGMPRITTGTSMTSYFYDDDPIYLESLALDRLVGGTLPLQVLVQPGEGVQDLLDPAAMRRMEAIAAYVETLPATGNALSGLDFIKEARRVIMGDPPGKLVRPASRQEAAQILLLIEGDGDRVRYLSEDNKHGRIEVPVAAGGYEELVSGIEEMERRLQEISGREVKARVTGLARLLAGMETYLFQSQARSFGLAFVLVLGFIALLFRSLRIGLLSAIPNLLPLVLVLGAMGWAGVRLDATTVMIGPILLGIVVDDTVHMLERVLAARRAGESVPDAFTKAAARVGPAVVMTTVILATGFLVLTLGTFRPNLYFALLCSLGLVLALAADLVVFPAVATLLPWLVVGPGRGAGLSRRPIPLEGHPDAEARLMEPREDQARGSVVVLLHGGGNNRDYGFWYLTERLLAGGHSVLAAHLPGHGKGGQDLFTLEACRQRLDLLLGKARAEAGERPVTLMGQSLGGTLALDLLTRPCPQPDKVVTVSAPTEVKLGGSMISELSALFRPSLYRALAYEGPYGALPAFGPFKRGAFPVRVPDGEHYIASFTRAVAEMDLPSRLRARPENPHVRIAIHHGARDGVIPAAQAAQLADALTGDVTLNIHPAVTHMDPLLNKIVVSRILEFTSSNNGGHQGP